MVFNNTRVFLPCFMATRKKTGARIEVFLLRELNAENKFWDVLVEPARKIRIGNKLYFGDDDSMVAEVIDNTTSRGRTLRFLYDGPYDEFKQALYSLGMTPAASIYQAHPRTLRYRRLSVHFRRERGAVVAPAAGLHFSRSLITRLKNQGRKRGFCDYSQRPWRIPRNRRGRLDKAPHGLRANGCRPAIGRYRQCGKRMGGIRYVLWVLRCCVLSQLPTAWVDI